MSNIDFQSQGRVLPRIPGLVRAVRNFLRGGRTLFAITLAVFALAGCASQAAHRNVDLFVRTAPLPVVVPAGQALAEAERQAAQREGDFALQGIGSSMQPVYAPGTALVVRPTAFHMLRKGMPVVYTNAKGSCVAHMLVERWCGGWLAIGLNNAEPDDLLVTKENLQGVVQYAFVSQSAAAPPAVAPVALETGRNYLAGSFLVTRNLQ